MYTRIRTFAALLEDAKSTVIYVDDQWQELSVPAKGLAITWCQLPLSGLALPADQSAEIFLRSGRIRQLNLVFGRSELFSE